MALLGRDANQDGESLLVDMRNGQWRAEGVDRTDLVAEAADLDALRPAIIEAARTRRRGEGLSERVWKVAYLWGVDVSPRPRGLRGLLRLRSGPRGPVLEVARATDGYAARAEDGSTVSASTLIELNERARQQYAPVGAAASIESITLFEVIEIPPEADGGG